MPALCRKKCSSLSWLFSLGILVALLAEVHFMQKSRDDERENAVVLAEAMAATGTAMVVIDQDGVVQMWSKGATKLFGYTADEMRGRDLHRLMPAESFTKHSTAIKNAAESGKLETPILRIHCNVVAKDGGTVPVQIAVRMIPKGDGKCLFHTVVNPDKIIQEMYTPSAANSRG